MPRSRPTIWKPKRTREGRTKDAESRFYWGSYTDPSNGRLMRRSLKTTDYSTAKLILAGW